MGFNKQVLIPSLKWFLVVIFAVLAIHFESKEGRNPFNSLRTILFNQVEIQNFSKSPVPDPVNEIKENPQDLHLLFVGDINLARHVNKELRKLQDIEQAFAYVQPFLHLADVRFGNLECVLTRQPLLKRPNHTYYLRAVPKDVHFLKLLKFDVLSLANNHTLDAGEDGLKETIQELTQNGIHAIGVSQSAKSWEQTPLTLERKGIRLAFLAYNDISLQIKTKKQFFPFPANTDRIHDEILRARQNHDVVIVSFHWGHEYDHSASKRQGELAEVAKKAGADLIVGHHSHAVQPISWDPEKKQLVAFSLGNFIFDLFRPSRLRKMRRSAILYVRVDSRTKKIKSFVPISVYLNKRYEPIPFFEFTSLNSLTNAGQEAVSSGYELRRNLKEAKVYLKDRGEKVAYDNWRTDVARFTFFEGEPVGEIALHNRWQAGDDARFSLGEGAEFSHGEFREIIWLRVPEKMKLIIEYPSIRWGESLEGFFGFPDWATMEPFGEPVDIQVFIGDQLIHSEKLKNRPGWETFRINTSQWKGKKLPIRIEFGTAGTQRRYVGFNAAISG